MPCGKIGVPRADTVLPYRAALPRTFVLTPAGNRAIIGEQFEKNCNMGPWLSWESAAFASLWSHIDLRVSAHDFGENFLRNLLKSKNLKICFLLQKTRKKRRYGPIAQLGERSVRIREVEGSNPFGSTISRKITAELAVIFRLTTIIPQTAENHDHFWNPQAVSSSPSPPADFRFMCLPVLPVLL